MDAKRFDDLARLLATSTDRRGALKRLAGAAVLGVGAWFRSSGNPGTAVAEPLGGHLPAQAGRTRLSPRRAPAPGTRPVTKGRHQTTTAATPTVVLSPTSGKIKTSVTVTLTGFRSSESIELRWFDGASSKPIASGLTSTGGKATITFVAPYAFRGYHVVRAIGNRGSQAEAKFAINPSFTLKPKSGLTGDTVKASLSGYASKALVNIYFFPGEGASGTPQLLTSVTLSSSGTGAATFTIPNGAAAGLHRIEGREQVSGRLSSAKFNVKECATATDCPAPQSECEGVACQNGVCVSEYVPAGTPVANQTAGDCLQNVCDGNGLETTQPDDNDVADDNNQCTTDLCINGTASYTPVATGSPCSSGGGKVCDPNGICVQCNLASDCPGTDTECSTKTCITNTCGVTNVSAMTPCTGGICDGNGTCMPTVCTPNEIRACYSGPPATRGVGICTEGSQSCGSDGSGWGPCNFEVTPTTELCSGLDEDCDGVIDNGFPVGEPCSGDDFTGVYQCSGDQLGVVCVPA